MQHKGRYYHADKRRIARLPRGNNGTTHREQMEIAHYSQPACPLVEIQRTSQRSRRHQPEGTDRQPARNGGGRDYHENRLPRSPAARGIRALTAWRDARSYP